MCCAGWEEAGEERVMCATVLAILILEIIFFWHTYLSRFNGWWMAALLRSCVVGRCNGILCGGNSQQRWCCWSLFTCWLLLLPALSPCCVWELGGRPCPCGWHGWVFDPRWSQGHARDGEVRAAGDVRCPVLPPQPHIQPFPCCSSSNLDITRSICIYLSIYVSSFLAGQIIAPIYLSRLPVALPCPADTDAPSHITVGFGLVYDESTPLGHVLQLCYITNNICTDAVHCSARAYHVDTGAMVYGAGVGIAKLDGGCTTY